MTTKDNTNTLVTTDTNLVGRITKYYFKASDSGFKIASFVDESIGQITIKGSLPDSSENIPLLLVGEFVTDKKYGRQFFVKKFVKELSKFTLEGIIKFFSGKNFPGVGKKYATKIVSSIGLDCLAKIKQDKTVLDKVNGISLAVKKTIIKQIESMEQKDYQLVKLLELQISENLAMKIIAKYEADSYQKVTNDPYILMDDFARIGFIKCDEIAKSLGIKDDDKRRLKALVKYSLDLGTKEGHSYLTVNQINGTILDIIGKETNISPIIDELHIEGKIRDDKGDIYPQKLYFCEKKVAHMLNVINHYPINFDRDEVSRCFLSHQQSSSYNYSNEQINAITTALSSKLTIITGGPGTGKTTIIRGIVETSKKVFKNPRITLVAPTGRAAKRMTETIGLSAHTIHKTLGYDFAGGSFARRHDNPLETDIVILDESSMVDVLLMYSLLDAIPQKAQLIIVGDVNQLPSVGPGLVLSDIINSNIFQTIRLTNVYRQKNGSEIIELAQQIKDIKLTKEKLISFSEDIKVYQLDDDHKTVEKIMQAVKYFLNNTELAITDFQILCPIYKSVLGVDYLNNLVQQAYIKPQTDTKNVVIRESDDEQLGFTIYEGDKVIQIENDYETDIMNGDLGIVNQILYDSDNNPIIVIDFDEREVNYTLEQMKKVKLAYAISVHKSQGSEYKRVIFPFGKSYYKNAKNELIYTAVTRSKEKLYLIGDMNYLVTSYKQHLTKRNSKLCERIINDRINQ